MVIYRSIHHYSYSNYSSMATVSDPFSPSNPATKIPPAFPPEFYVLPSVVGTKIAMENDPFIDDLLINMMIFYSILLVYQRV